MIDLVANLILGAWLGFGALVYLWLLMAWFTKPERRADYPGAPLVALVIIPLWPVVFALIVTEPEDET